MEPPEFYFKTSHLNAQERRYLDSEQSAMSTATEHLRQTPWCRALIDDADWVPTMTWSRVKKVRNTEDTFFAETLGTDRTIRHCLTLRPKQENTKDVEDDNEPAFKEVRTIMELGSGLNGHPDVCHGGFVATMLDEVMGVLIQLNLEKKVRRLKRRKEGHPGLSCFTACKCFVFVRIFCFLCCGFLGLGISKGYSTGGESGEFQENTVQRRRVYLCFSQKGRNLYCDWMFISHHQKREGREDVSGRKMKVEGEGPHQA